MIAVIAVIAVIVVIVVVGVRIAHAQTIGWRLSARISAPRRPGCGAENPYEAVQWGGRFSINAMSPSLVSAEPMMRPNASFVSRRRSLSDSY